MIVRESPSNENITMTMGADEFGIFVIGLGRMRESYKLNGHPRFELAEKMLKDIEESGVL